MNADVQTAIIALLIGVVVAVVWLAVEVRKLHRDIAPIATSPLATGLSSLGR